MKWWKPTLVILLTVVLLLGAGLLVTAQSPIAWELQVIGSPNPLVLPEGDEALIMVRAQTTTTTTAPVLIHCPRPTNGRIVTVTHPAVPLYIGDEIVAATWNGSVSDTAALEFTYTVAPAALLEQEQPLLSAVCRLYDSGRLQIVSSDAVQIVPWEVFLPLAFHDYSTPEEISASHRETWAGLGQSPSVCRDPTYQSVWSGVLSQSTIEAGWNDYEHFRYIILRQFMHFEIPDPHRVVSATLKFDVHPYGNNSVAEIGLWRGHYPPPPTAWSSTDIVTIGSIVGVPGLPVETPYTLPLPSHAIEEIRSGVPVVFLFKIDNECVNDWRVVSVGHDPGATKLVVVRR